MELSNLFLNLRVEVKLANNLGILQVKDFVPHFPNTHWSSVEKRLDSVAFVSIQELWAHALVASAFEHRLVNAHVCLIL